FSGPGSGACPGSFQLCEGAAGLVDAGVAEALSQFERRGQSLAGQFAFAKAEVGDATEVQPVSLAPGVPAVRSLGAVKCGASMLEGPGGCSRDKQALRQSHAQFDGVLAKAATIGKKNAGLAFRYRLREIAESTLQFARGAKASQLQLHDTRARGE